MMCVTCSDTWGRLAVGRPRGLLLLFRKVGCPFSQDPDDHSIFQPSLGFPPQWGTLMDLAEEKRGPLLGIMGFPSLVGVARPILCPPQGSGPIRECLRLGP